MPKKTAKTGPCYDYQEGDSVRVGQRVCYRYGSQQLLGIGHITQLTRYTTNHVAIVRKMGPIHLLQVMELETRQTVQININQLADIPEAEIEFMLALRGATA